MQSLPYPQDEGFIIQGLDAKTNDIAKVSLAATPNNWWQIHYICFGYRQAPTGGKLTVKFNGVVVLETDVLTNGGRFWDFGGALCGAEGDSVDVELADGGALVLGTLIVGYR